MSTTETHPIQRFGTSGSIAEVNPNDYVWQRYLGLGYQGIRALQRRRWPSAAAAAAAATITSLTPNTAVVGSTGGVTSVAVVGTNFVVGATQFSYNGQVVTATVSSATAATISLPNGAVGTFQVRALNPGRAPSAPSTFTVTAT